MLSITKSRAVNKGTDRCSKQRLHAPCAAAPRTSPTVSWLARTNQAGSRRRAADKTVHKFVSYRPIGYPGGMAKHRIERAVRQREADSEPRRVAGWALGVPF